MIKLARTGIGGRLMSLFLILSLFPLVTVGFLTFYSSRKMLSESIGSKLPDLASQVMEKIDRVFYFALKNTQAWAELEVMQDILTKDADARISTFLMKVKKGYGVYKDIYCIDTKGEIISSSNLEAIGTAVSNEKWFTRALKGKVYVKDVYYSNLDNAFVVNFSVPVYALDDKNKVIGILSAHLDWNTISDTINRVMIDGKKQTIFSHLVMINKDGYVLTEYGFLGEEKKGVMLKDNLIDKGLKSARLATSGEQGWLIELSEFKKNSLIGYAPSRGYADFKGLGWALLAIKSLKEAYAPIRKLESYLVAIGILMIFIIIVTASFVARSIANPIVELSRVAKLIAQGDLAQRVKVQGKDELAELGGAFNTMVDGLRKIIESVLESSDKVSNYAQNLSASTEEINASTEQISSTIQEVAKRTSSQVGKVEETFSIVRELSNSVRRVSDNTSYATTVSEDAGKKAKSGGEAIKAAIEKLGRIGEIVTNSADVVKNLGSQSDRIGEIVEVINNIADQTNLLALNAAIEAARAGDVGRGFAVVAEEVKKLAEESAKSTEEISKLIKSIQGESYKATTTMDAATKEVSLGKDIATKANQALEEIVGVIKDNAKIIYDIFKAAEEQLQGAEAVNKAVGEIASSVEEVASAIEEISSSTQEQSASMEEMTASAQELAQLAVELKEVVSKFKLN